MLSQEGGGQSVRTEPLVLCRCCFRMKVELVKVKINKLKEVKKQLRKRKCVPKKNLKKLLLDNEEREHEDNIYYQSINALFEEDEKNKNESIHTSRCSDSPISDYHIDLEDVLESLGICENDFLQEVTSESLLNEPKINLEEREKESENLAVDDNSMNSFSCLVNKDNSIIEQVDDICLPDDIESILFSNTNKENFQSTTNISNTQLEPNMSELGNYYIPDTLFNTTNDQTMIDYFSNAIEISIPEDTNEENIDEQIEYNEIEDPVASILNNNNEGETNNNTENEMNSNEVKGIAIVNPLLVNIPAADLQTMALYQLQQKNDSNEINNLGDTKILENYTWEQKANIIASAKMLFTKRTRTLLHWLDPNITLAKLRATLELSWENLPLWQKEVYISQVMGPLAMEASTPMLNPQLKSGELKMSNPASPKKPQKERKRFSDFITNV